MASALALLAGLLVALLAATPAASASGEYELNDDRDSAHGPLEGGQEYTATFETDNDVDWFYFYVGQRSQMDISLTKLVDAECEYHGPVELTVFDNDGGQVTASHVRSVSKTEHSLVTLATGHYYLRAQGNPECGGSRYRFRIDPADALTDRPPEIEEPEPSEPPENEEPESVARPTLTAGPQVRTSRRRATFQFSSNHDGGRFQCKLTGQRVPRALRRWRPCTSPKRYTGLNLGKKVFWLRELDDGVSSPPFRRAWTVAKAPIRMAVKGRTAAMPLRCSNRRSRCRGVIVIRAGKYMLARGRYSLPAGRRGYARLGLSKVGRRALTKSKRARGRAVFVELPTRKRNASPVVLVTRDRS